MATTQLPFVVISAVWVQGMGRPTKKRAHFVHARSSTQAAAKVDKTLEPGRQIWTSSGFSEDMGPMTRRTFAKHGYTKGSENALLMVKAGARIRLKMPSGFNGWGKVTSVQGDSAVCSIHTVAGPNHSRSRCSVGEEATQVRPLTDLVVMY